MTLGNQERCFKVVGIEDHYMDGLKFMQRIKLLFDTVGDICDTSSSKQSQRNTVQPQMES